MRLTVYKPNYTPRKWLVITISIDGNPSSPKISFDYSEGFHTASSYGTFAAAISFDGIDVPDFTDHANDHLHDFKFPVKLSLKVLSL